VIALENTKIIPLAFLQIKMRKILTHLIIMSYPRDKLRLQTLRSIRSAIIEFNKSGSETEMSEEIATDILMKQAKKRKDAIEMYKQGNRQDLADKEATELEIINEFLPKQMSEDEIAEAVKKIITDTKSSSMKDMGKVMGLAMKELKGKADGNMVKDIVKKELEA
jgi:uncharacterized protein